MQQFIEKYAQHVQGVVSGFDRLVFRGSLRRLNYGWRDPGRQVFVAKGWNSTAGKTRYCLRITRIVSSR